MLCGKAEIDDEKKFVIENSDNLMTLKLKKEFIVELVKQFLQKIKVKKLELYFTGGFVEDSYSSALVCGSVSAISQTVYSLLSQTYNDIKIYEDVTPTFNETNLNLTANVGVSISLLSIIISLIKADKLTGQNKGVEYEK